jgi:hypothetical protein
MARLRVLLVVLAATGCSGASARVLLPDPERAPPEIREGCKRAEVRCSSCHTIERVLTSQRRGFLDWRDQVQRMRLMPASGITVEDADMIVRCLVYRDDYR